MGGVPANLLTVDCGNSTIDCLAHGSGRRLRLDSARQDRGALGAFVQDVAPARCVAVSVVPGGLDTLAMLLEECRVPLQVAGRDLPCPLPLDYATPGTLGPDRWLSTLAAWRLHGRAVVVDCGSATTVNLVEQDGTFRGGPIAPGLRAFVAGLVTVAPGLPAPRLDAQTSMPPRSSQSAVDTGVLLGYCGLVERLVADVLRAAAGPAAVLVTGGNAPRLLLHTRLRCEHEPDLVHQGLRIVAGGGS